MENHQYFKIHFKWVGAATWILDINGLKIACDPVLCPKGTVQVYAPGSKSKRLTEPVFDEGDFDNIDIWLISHDHEDHLDEYGLVKIKPETFIVANRKSEKTLKQNSPDNLNLIKWDQVVSHNIKGMEIEIKAVPTVHANNFLVAYFLGGGNGYWVKIKNDEAELNIYVTGDTINHKKVINALSGEKADILIPNIGAPFKNSFGGPYTFTVDTLQPVIDKVNPNVILPVHFGSFSHFFESNSTVKAWDNNNVKIFSEGDSYRNY